MSRSTLSRAERAEISPTAAMLNRLCAVFGRTMSQLLSEVEGESALLVRAADQPVWRDRASGFVRRSVSPPQAGLRGELVEGRLAVGADIAYGRPPVPGLEQHVWVLEGVLAVTVRDVEHRLGARGLPAVAGLGPDTVPVCGGRGRPVRAGGGAAVIVRVLDELHVGECAGGNWPTCWPVRSTAARRWRLDGPACASSTCSPAARHHRRHGPGRPPRQRRTGARHGPQHPRPWPTSRMRRCRS
ncbi:hypothetical protein GCM10020295_01180 [Streptomyces cinereospinus]